MTSNRVTSRKHLALGCCIALLGFAGVLESVATFLLKRNVVESSAHVAAIGRKDEESQSSELLRLQSLYAETQDFNRIRTDHFVYPYLLGKLASRIGLLSGDSAITCEALTHYQNAIAASPARSLFHLSWAKTALAAENQGIACPTAVSIGDRAFPDSEPNTKGIAQARAQWARDVEPAHSSSLYLGSIVEQQLGNTEQALRNMHQLERWNPVFSEPQRRIFFGMVSSRTDLEAAISRRYPDVIHWIEHFSKERPQEYLKWENVFAAALEQALSSLQKQMISGHILPLRTDKAVRRIAEHEIVRRNDELRQSVDLFLAYLHQKRNNTAWATFLKRRAQLIRIPVLKSYLRKDVLPRDTMLSRWREDQSDEVIVLSRLNSVAGFFVPDGYQVDLIVVQNHARQKEKATNPLEVRLSTQNHLFEIARDTVEVRHFVVDRREKIIVETPEAKYRYAKLRLAGSAEGGAFRHAFSSLLEVYGKKLE